MIRARSSFCCCLSLFIVSFFFLFSEAILNMLRLKKIVEWNRWMQKKYLLVCKSMFTCPRIAWMETIFICEWKIESSVFVFTYSFLWPMMTSPVLLSYLDAKRCSFNCHILIILRSKIFISFSQSILQIIEPQLYLYTRQNFFHTQSRPFQHLSSRLLHVHIFRNSNNFRKKQIWIKRETNFN